MSVKKESLSSQNIQKIDPPDSKKILCGSGQLPSLEGTTSGVDISRAEKTSVSFQKENPNKVHKKVSTALIGEDDYGVSNSILSKQNLFSVPGSKFFHKQKIKTRAHRFNTSFDSRANTTSNKYQSFKMDTLIKEGLLPKECVASEAGIITNKGIISWEALPITKKFSRSITPQPQQKALPLNTPIEQKINLDFYQDCFTPTETDKKIFEYINLARTNPSFIVAELKKILYKQISNDMFSTQALEEAIHDLSVRKPQKELEWSQGLFRVCHAHILDLGPKGIVSHEGSDHRTILDRLKVIGVSASKCEECFQEGKSNPEDIVLALVVDQYNSNKRQRRAIFNSSFVSCGLSSGPHSKHKDWTVVGFLG